MFILGLLLSIFFVSLIITVLTRRYALSNGLYDLPNERSSHTVATPRGGGVAIALSLFAALLVLQWNHFLATKVMYALLGGGVLVALIGWRDDHKHVPAQWRILVHSVAALWALYWLYGAPAQWDILTWAQVLITVLAIVWLTNLYNFMDGIDGLAGSEAVYVGVAGGVLLWLGGAYGLALVSFCLATASAGFLVLNWPPAKIFMGDVGSGLLGFSFAILILASNQSETLPLGAWIVLFAIFILDTSCTLLWRISHHELWLQPHRSHAYQRLVQLGASHGQVTSWSLLINSVVLSPLAFLTMWKTDTRHWVILLVVVAGGFLWFYIQRKFLTTQA